MNPCKLKKQKQLLLGSSNGQQCYESYDIYELTIQHNKKKERKERK